MRQFNLPTAALAFAALLSSAPAMAQAYNENNTGWNRGGTLKTDTVGKTPMCFKTGSGKFDGPRLAGTSDAATHGWQNFWGPCGGDVEGNTGSSFGAAGPRDLKHARR